MISRIKQTKRQQKHLSFQVFLFMIFFEEKNKVINEKLYLFLNKLVNNKDYGILIKVKY